MDKKNGFFTYGSLKQYFNDIKKYKLLSHEDEKYNHEKLFFTNPYSTFIR